MSKNKGTPDKYVICSCWQTSQLSLFIIMYPSFLAKNMYSHATDINLSIRSINQLRVVQKLRLQEEGVGK